MGLYQEAEDSYLRAIAEDREHSPFSLAWACFQLGVLFGETLEPAQPATAQYWYEQALSYMPIYTHARVHLAELHLDAGRFNVALDLLLPIQDSEACLKVAAKFAREGEALFETAVGAIPQAISAGVFGVGFALRLVRAEVGSAGGGLTRKGDRLRLELPALTLPPTGNSDEAILRDRG